VSKPATSFLVVWVTLCLIGVGLAWTLQTQHKLDHVDHRLKGQNCIVVGQ
jgi:hypothetical protein